MHITFISEGNYFITALFFILSSSIYFEIGRPTSEDEDFDVLWRPGPIFHSEPG